jgi:RNA polymerase sigma factor (sigma-70 family)
MVLFSGDRILGEEIAQEALTRALERWDRVGRMASPEAWVYRTGFNVARSWARRRVLEQRANARITGSGLPAELPDSATAVAVREAVAALPARQRAVIVCRFYGGLSVAETAHVMSCASGTVKALTHRAIAGLRAAGLVDDEEVVVDVTPE